MPDSEKKIESAHVLDDYMLKLLEHSINNSKRHEERSDKAIQLFMALFTVLAGGGVAILTSGHAVTLKLSVLAFDLSVMTGFGVLTYVWVLSSNVTREMDWMERYFLFKYFDDRDHSNFEKYGQTAYSLDVYRPTFEDKSAQSPLVIASSFSLAALVIFDGVACAGAVYTGLLALGIGSMPLAIALAIAGGILCAVVLIFFWRLAWKNSQTNKTKGKEILKHHKSSPPKPSPQPAHSAHNHQP
jgi:hypothetical protein